MPSPSFGDYRQYQWGLHPLYPLGFFFQFLAEVKRKKWRCRVPHSQTVAATPSFSGLCQRCEGQSTSSFSFFQQPRTDLPFCHSQPCHVHLFHLNLVKYRHMAGFVVWWRACGEEMFFFLLFFFFFVSFCAYAGWGQDRCCGQMSWIIFKNGLMLMYVQLMLPTFSSYVSHYLP